MPWVVWENQEKWRGVSKGTDGTEPEATPACHTSLDLSILPTIFVASYLRHLNDVELWSNLARAVRAPRHPGSVLEG